MIRPFWLFLTLGLRACAGTGFTTHGGPLTATVGRLVGAKVGLFATGAGHTDFDWFRVTEPLP